MLWQYIFLQKDFSPNRTHQQIKKCKPVNRLSSQKASVFFDEKKIIRVGIENMIDTASRCLKKDINKKKLKS